MKDNESRKITHKNIELLFIMEVPTARVRLRFWIRRDKQSSNAHSMSIPIHIISGQAEIGFIVQLGQG